MVPAVGGIWLRVQVEEDEGNSEQRSEQRLDEAQCEAKEVERLCFRACCERLKDSLRILGSGQLLEIMAQ